MIVLQLADRAMLGASCRPPEPLGAAGWGTADRGDWAGVGCGDGVFDGVRAGVAVGGVGVAVAVGGAGTAGDGTDAVAQHVLRAHLTSRYSIACL